MNQCTSCEECWSDACTKINNETFIGEVEYGEEVIFLRKDDRWYYIQKIAVKKVGLLLRMAE